MILSRLTRFRWLPVLLAVGVALLCWGGLRGRGSPPSPPTSADTVQVTRGDLAAVVEATGRVEAERRADLSLPLGGTLQALFVEVGDEVAAGAPLLALDPQEIELRLREAAAGLAVVQAQRAEAEAGGSTATIEAAQARVQAARLALSVAEVELDGLAAEAQGDSEEAVRVEQARAALQEANATLRRLVDGPSAEERAVLDAQVGQAQARLAQAEAALAQSTLRAPFAGTIVARSVNVGERAGPGQTLLALADLHTLVAVADVDEVDVGRIRAGQPVTVTLDAFPARPLVGEVTRVAPAADPARGATTYRTMIRFEPADLPVRLDMAVDARIATGAALDALLLPLVAIRYAEQQPYVVVQRQGQSVPLEVTLGAQDERMVEIVAGLEEGESVLLP